MEMRGDSEPVGDCYTAAYDAVAKLFDEMRAGEQPESPLCLVHGSVVPLGGPQQGTRIDHAWIEIGQDVMEVSLGQKLRFPKERYEATFHAHVRVRYSHTEAIWRHLESGNYGPWDTTASERTPLPAADEQRKPV